MKHPYSSSACLMFLLVDFQYFVPGFRSSLEKSKVGILEDILFVLFFQDLGVFSHGSCLMNIYNVKQLHMEYPLKDENGFWMFITRRDLTS